MGGCVRAFHELQGVMKTLMRNGRDRRSENPLGVTRGKIMWYKPEARGSERTLVVHRARILLAFLAHFSYL